MIIKYNIRYRFLAQVFVVLGPSRTEDGMEILKSLEIYGEFLFEYKKYENGIK